MQFVSGVRISAEGRLYYYFDSVHQICLQSKINNKGI